MSQLSDWIDLLRKQGIAHEKIVVKMNDDTDWQISIKFVSTAWHENDTPIEILFLFDGNNNFQDIFAQRI